MGKLKYAILWVGFCIWSAISFSTDALARCAFVDKHYTGVSIAPGPPKYTADKICFNTRRTCNKKYGCFKGRLRLSRNFIRSPGKPKMKKLMARFGYIDPKGVHWDVPAGFETDGATIPPGLKLVVGGSWNKYYIKAAVLHDFYIRDSGVKHEDVHRMFFDALLATGVPHIWAERMHWAVQKRGPKWDSINLEENERNRIANENFARETREGFRKLYVKFCVKQRYPPPGVDCKLLSRYE